MATPPCQQGRLLAGLREAQLRGTSRDLTGWRRSGQVPGVFHRRCPAAGLGSPPSIRVAGTGPWLELGPPGPWRPARRRSRRAVTSRRERARAPGGCGGRRRSEAGGPRARRRLGWREAAHSLSATERPAWRLGDIVSDPRRSLQVRSEPAFSRPSCPRPAADLTRFGLNSMKIRR